MQQNVESKCTPSNRPYYTPVVSLELNTFDDLVLYRAMHTVGGRNNVDGPSKVEVYSVIDMSVRSNFGFLSSSEFDNDRAALTTPPETTSCRDSLMSGSI